VLIQTPHPYPSQWNIHITITAMRVFFAFTQMIACSPWRFWPCDSLHDRPSCMASASANGFAPDKASFTWTWPSVHPTLGPRFSITVTRSRSGAMRWKVSAGILSRIPPPGPLIVPVTHASILTGEEVIDGHGPARLWGASAALARELHYEGAITRSWAWRCYPGGFPIILRANGIWRILGARLDLPSDQASRCALRTSKARQMRTCSFTIGVSSHEK